MKDSRPPLSRGVQQDMTQPEMPLDLVAQPQVPPAASGTYPVRTGNIVRPLVDGIPAFRRIGEAIDGARHSVWLTVTFFAPDFRFPDGGGSLFDVLDRAVARGLDVRVIFWRPNPESSGYGRTFPGSQAERDLLQARGSRFRIRWDRAYAAYCQHQKSWVIDAGQRTETAFVGGINLTSAAMGWPGHLGGGERHDLYVEITGPSATDVHHNFIQRWNEASEREADDGVWADNASETLPFPTRRSDPRGTSLVQIQRMVHPGHYTDGRPTPGGLPYNIAAGERSILEQYELAIDAARSTIYIENQAIPVPAVAARLRRALERRVDVILLVPAQPEDHVYAARKDPARRSLFDGIEALARYQNFLLAGLVTVDRRAGTRSTYVHAKIMLVDDVWATIGSCNLHSNSLSGSTEMNAAIWDAEVVRALRCELLAEHLGQKVDSLDDRAALRLYRQVATRNRLTAGKRGSNFQGLAIALTTSEYGTERYDLNPAAE